MKEDIASKDKIVYLSSPFRKTADNYSLRFENETRRSRPNTKIFHESLQKHKVKTTLSCSGLDRQFSISKVSPTYQTC